MSDSPKSEAPNLSTYEDDFDGEYKYTKLDSLSAKLFQILKIKKLRPDRRKKSYGRIKGNIFCYVSMPMIFVFGMVTWVVVASFSKLIPYYETNVALNSIIISLLIFGILKAFHNSYLLYKTAVFFRLVEEVLRKAEIPTEDIYKLRRLLEKNGQLVNTVAMAETLDSIEKYGHPNFNDQRARLIKSKLGYRVAKNKGNVSYISGMLVMLGLLGTFLGLLATIDAVGDALKSMSQIGGDGGEIGVEEMGMFIGSLAKPLDGMGLAFSSSLFGLSGSLLIGFFLYLAGTPQNLFMENIGRWIDDRIPNPDPDKKKKDKTQAKLNQPTQEKDLKDWLAGFVNMSVKTNKMINNLCQEISTSTEETKKVWEGTEAVHLTQQRLITTSENTNLFLKKIDSHNAVISEVMPQMSGNISHMSQIMQSEKDSQSRREEAEKTNYQVLTMIKDVTESSYKMQEAALNSNIDNSQSLITIMSSTQDMMSQALVNLQKLTSHPVGEEAVKSLKVIEKNIADMNNSHQNVSNGLKELLTKMAVDPYAAKQTETLIKRLEVIMSELNIKFKDFIGK